MFTCIEVVCDIKPWKSIVMIKNNAVENVEWINLLMKVSLYLIAHHRMSEFIIMESVMNFSSFVLQI